MKFVRLLLAMFLGVAMIAGCSKQRGSEASSDSGTSSSASNAGAANTDPSASSANAPTTANKPEDFMKEAAKGGIMEVQMAQMGMKQAHSPEVKRFAQMLITDHKKANQQLMTLAKKNNVVLPADEASDKSASEDHQDLANLKGAEFDREFMNQAVEHHEKEVKQFEEQANSGSNENADLKAFAQQTLPTLQKHLQMAQSIQSKMSGSSSADHSGMSQMGTTGKKQ